MQGKEETCARAKDTQGVRAGCRARARAARPLKLANLAARHDEDDQHRVIGVPLPCRNTCRCRARLPFIGRP